MNFKVFILISLYIIKYISAFKCLPCDKYQCKKIECCASGETTLDVLTCHCCPVCTKTVQETCGGLWEGDGECATGLYCLKKRLKCQTQQGENCIFPFKFKGKKYGRCTSDYLKKGRWCATGVHRNGTMMKSRWGHCNLGSSPVSVCLVEIKHVKQGAKGICVDKKQIMNQWKTYNKSIEYSFVSWERNKENKENMEKRRKIKRCSNPGSYPLCDPASDPLCDLVPADQACDFKEGIKDLKQEMTKMKRELIIAIHAQKSKNCRQQQYECNRKCLFNQNQYYKPICGTDGKTYNNVCNMKVSTCKSNSRIDIWYKGKCGECAHCWDDENDRERCHLKCCPLRCSKAKNPERCINKCKDPYPYPLYLNK